MLQRESRAGIYLTVSIHLGIFILFLVYQIGFQLQQEAAFVLDFTAQEEAQRVWEREELRTQVSEELDALLSGNVIVPRNVVVDASERDLSERGRSLRDDRFRDPSIVYEEAKQLQAKLDASRRAAEALQGSDEVLPQKVEQTDTEVYTGPSVISWRLEGRKVTHLPIPVYKCLAGGDVTVIILVDRRGYVVSASIATDFSSSDSCLREYAMRAALSSRFSADANAPTQQQGEIVYRFVAQ